MAGDRRMAVFDDGGLMAGRGAWVCRDNPECLAKALKPGRLARAFRAKDGPVLLMTG
jgi:predicted RNA-binding protein YlxR (DUF448 family)